MTDRRAFLSGLALAPVAMVAPAVAMTAISSPDPVTAYWAAWHGYNGDAVSEEAFARATDDLDFWEPTTLRDFVRKFVAVFHDGDMPSADRLELLIVQGKRLTGEA